MDFFAYIDPGAGSLFIQAIVGALLSIIVVMRNFFIRAFYKIKNIFSRSIAADEKE